MLTLIMKFIMLTAAQRNNVGTVRAVLAFLAHHLALSKSKHLVWNSAAGMIETTLQSSQLIETLMTVPVLEHSLIPFSGNTDQLSEDISVCGQTFNVTPVSMGNPHGVIFVDTLVGLDVEQIGGELTAHEVFPERANIGFLPGGGRALYTVACV